MKPLRLFVARLLALLLMLAGAGLARADTPIALWKAFDGRVNFTGTQVSIRAYSNSSAPCTIYAPDVNRKANLTIPTGATVLSAQLYWAGSGSADYTVTFEGKEITASRKYSSSTIGNGFNYFGGAADVTTIVKPKGGGEYVFSGLSVANGAPWCGSQGVLGGFSLLVVYSLPSEPERVLNLYEGFRYVQNGEVEVKASNFRWDRKSYSVKEKARVGHLTWEGDPTLGKDGEQLIFEDVEMTDGLNPAGNQFNSSSNINNASASYGIDFDAYDTSVTIWSGYDAAVTTIYRAGQDMVILNAEMLVVPTLPVSDLSISIVRAGAMKVGADVQYKVTVTNNGPYTESGAITVTNTLPAGMYYTSGTVTGWSCNASTTSGTCVYRGGLAPGASAPVLTVYTRVTSTGQKVNTVKVTGTATDDDLTNNTASDTGTATNPDGTTAPPPPPPKYILTDKACTAGVALGAVGQCKKYSAATVGGKPTPIYLTATNDKGVPAVASDKGDLTPSMEFMLICNNPTVGAVEASYAGATIPVCAAENAAPAWSRAASITFPKGAVSVQQTLVYDDVGKITLTLRESGGTASTEVFVSAPAQIGFSRISYGGSDNRGATTGTGTALAPAGAFVAVEVGALLYKNKGYAPSFGRETPQPRFLLTHARNAEAKILYEGTLNVAGQYVWNKGIATLQAAWSEVGAIDFKVDLADPDGSNDSTLARYFGEQVGGTTVAVGRFYPAYFKTRVTGAFDCPADLPSKFTCPNGGTLGAVYSQQPFAVTVEAYNDANVRVRNFGGDWFKKVTLSAVAADGAVLVPDLTPQSGATGATIDKATELKDNTGKVTDYELSYRPSYKLAKAYNNASPNGTDVTDPTGVHVRAASDAGPDAKPSITSVRAGVGTTEEGVLVLNGRLKLPNALGSDLAPTPLLVQTQYWAGAAAGWKLNRGFADPAGAAVTAERIKEALFCSATFLGQGETCDAVIKAMDPTLIITGGRGQLRLRGTGKRPGGAARSGYVTLRFNGWDWLPGTTGRISFGSHRSPVIYVREMYY